MNSFADIDEVYVINLPERADRRELIDKELSQYGVAYTLVEAVKNDNGILGLLDSMKKLFSESISKGQSNIMVLEDDATFLAPPIEFLNTVLTQLPQDYHCFYLGANLINTPERYSENILKIRSAYATHAIIYSRAAIDIIMSLLDNHITAYDIILMNNLQGHGKCYCTYPLLATQQPGYSNIEKRIMDWSALMFTHFNLNTRNIAQYPNEVKKPDCFEAHRVGDVIPQEHNLELHGKKCNCGMFRYVAEECSCPGKRELRLKTYLANE